MADSPALDIATLQDMLDSPLFAAYVQRAGTAVDPQRVHFWEVVGTLRWGVMCLDLASSYPQFRQTDPGRAVERAMIGRRVSETDIDLLRLLAPR